MFNLGNVGIEDTTPDFKLDVEGTLIVNQTDGEEKEIKINNVSNKTAYLELNEMRKKNILRVEGKGRATKYVFR